MAAMAHMEDSPSCVYSVRFEKQGRTLRQHCFHVFPVSLFFTPGTCAASAAAPAGLPVLPLLPAQCPANPVAERAAEPPCSQATQTGRPPLPVSAANQSFYWEFSVEDNGIGIAPEYAEAVFAV